MYVVRTKKKTSLDHYYINGHKCSLVKEIRDENHYLSIKDYIMSKKKAKELMLSLIMQNNSMKDEYWYLDYVALVELSNYYPYPEYEVLEYKEFK